MQQKRRMEVKIEKKSICIYEYGFIFTNIYRSGAEGHKHRKKFTKTTLILPLKKSPNLQFHDLTISDVIFLYSANHN